jgi:hypothetical protein
MLTKDSLVAVLFDEEAQGLASEAESWTLCFD